MKGLNIIKLKGIGISLVNFIPQEVAYISLEGLTLLQENCQYKIGSTENTFTKFEMSLRNF